MFTEDFSFTVTHNIGRSPARQRKRASHPQGGDEKLMPRKGDGCCRLAASRRALGSLWPVFGSERFPCCGGEGNRTPPAVALRARSPPMQLQRLAGIRTIIIAGDSVARQLTMALLCAIEEANNGIWPQLGVDVSAASWLRRASLVATYRGVNCTVALLGGAPLGQIMQAVKEAPRPTRVLLMGGGLPGLGHHWFDAVEPGTGQPRCRNAVQAATDGTSVPAASLGCYTWYESSASAVLISLVRAADGCRQCLHVLSTTPQHHPTTDGEHNSAARSKQELNMSAAYGSIRRDQLQCVPHPRASFRIDHWRNHVLRRVTLLSGSHFHDSFQNMGDMWDAHRERVGRGERVETRVDCLHWVRLAAALGLTRQSCALSPAPPSRQLIPIKLHNHITCVCTHYSTCSVCLFVSFCSAPMGLCGSLHSAKWQQRSLPRRSLIPLRHKKTSGPTAKCKTSSSGESGSGRSVGVRSGSRTPLSSRGRWGWRRGGVRWRRSVYCVL